jgi:hypothetical protein
MPLRRVAAAKLLGIDEVPTIRLIALSEDEILVNPETGRCHVGYSERSVRRKRKSDDRQLSLDFQGGHAALPRFWQRRFYDFNVWSLKKRVEKLHYMHMNPLKRKLVSHPKQCPGAALRSTQNREAA